MRTTYSLSIAKPCNEKWEDFTPQDKGGYCSSCAKVVVDFTTMSDYQILEFLKNKKAHTCGRFTKDQLKSYQDLQLPKINPGFNLLKASLLCFVLILTAKTSTAQDALAKTATEQIIELKAVSTGGATVTRNVMGIVKDENGDPLPGVNVIVKNTTIGTSTNADGEFQLTGDFKEGDVLLFSFIGYETKEFSIPKNAAQSLEIPLTVDVRMTMDTVIMMGEIAIDNVYEEKSSVGKFWDKVKNFF
ncbi:carboxypeptidase-like regulatory domain-containing protein [Pseudochryseolinea flava]|uniref:Carboxypeptidase-like regulatory domain-containing protein n=1 Tax=Pseudochryseolinea flava TaxID=2059302 RepID=A0A364Y1X6_9BACT|nr:carboxypeptidase-like regulatory domain-containing protein [Pseudochryseolinea flava]RAW00640.1 hypothetical protein DQQ10_13700 [Pseudochryseolinea flava]